MSVSPDERYLSPIWHPCSQMKDYEVFSPLSVERAEGCHITLKDGRRLIDAIASWWCKSLGHNHPALKQALLEQVEQFEHVILANTTNEVISALAEKLTSLAPSLTKTFFAGDGSCAVEIAMKMSLHAHQIKGESQRQQFMALSNGYHGETLATLSVTDVGLYREPYSPLLFHCDFITPAYVNSVHDPHWHDASEAWSHALPHLEEKADTLTAILVEPIVQGAGGMKLYSQDFLGRLRQWTQKKGIHLIADEIMTGIGRTGYMLACEHAGIDPDFVCLSKGLTSGWLPFSAVLTTDPIYDLFYADYATGHDFLHSHTFCGNALGARIALATLKVFDETQLCHTIRHTLHPQLLSAWQEVAETTGYLNNVRGIGGMVAAELCVDNPNTRAGFAIYQEATQRGALLRPLGNTLYWQPPLTIDENTLEELKIITIKAIKHVLD